MADLAVLIPAYKKIYFDQALQSLANQTNKNFNVYIGDDHSPEDLTPVVDKYRNALNITYHRFDNNIGSKNLVNQWKRCVQLSKGEEWLWLFSDDDLVQDNCVENFYAALERTKKSFEVYRFNTCVIDQDGKEIHRPVVSPEQESSEEMAYQLLLGHRGNSIADHIYSREVYERCGGYVFTNYAQAADWASSILFSQRKGMYVIAGAFFYWRYSGNNISSTAYHIRNQTTAGHLQFLQWISIHFTYLIDHPRSGVTYGMMMDAALHNFTHILINHYKGFNMNYSIHLLFFLTRVFHLSYWQAVKRLANIKYMTASKTNLVYRTIRKLRPV